MAPTTIAYIVSSLLIILSLIVPLSKCNHHHPLSTSLTLDLIQRDSRQSPLYNPSLSDSQRLVNAFRRSINRLQPADITTQSDDKYITNDGGEYFITYSVGTPLFQFNGTFDTGSELTWMPCQSQQSLVFNPESSSTYRKINCSSPQCQSFTEHSCTAGTVCSYSLTLGDQTTSQGNLSTDVFKLGDQNIPNMTFGCTINKDNKSGVVGFGGGSLSLVNQFHQKKLSYCLVSLSGKSDSSKLILGDKATVSGNRTVSTPLVANQKKPAFYYVGLQGISVGKEMLKTSSPNIIIGSGTTVTMLPNDLYSQLYNTLVKSLRTLARVPDPNKLFDLCYKIQDIKLFPDITVHFNEADVKWKQDNIFANVSDSAMCLAALPAAKDADAIYGNLAQTNFLVGIDLDKKKVFFKPSTCG